MSSSSISVDLVTDALRGVFLDVYQTLDQARFNANHYVFNVILPQLPFNVPRSMDELHALFWLSVVRSRELARQNPEVFAILLAILVIVVVRNRAVLQRKVSSGEE